MWFWAGVGPEKFHLDKILNGGFVISVGFNMCNIWRAVPDDLKKKDHYYKTECAASERTYALKIEFCCHY